MLSHWKWKKELFNLGNKCIVSEKKGEMLRSKIEELDYIQFKNYGKHRQYIIYSFIIPILFVKPLTHEK